MNDRAPATAGADRCPLCGEANGCAIAARTKEPCWCVAASFDAALRERAAPAEGPPRCICARCAGTTVGETPARTPPAR